MRWLAILLLLASPVMAGDFGMADQGYLSRANGMDWDDDFDYGDAQDGLACDDADTDGAVIVAEDIDGDSELEQQIYVIPATGTDDSNCGGPNAADACDSVQYVLDNRMNADADADTEDIICLVGTSNEQLSIGDIDGVAGYKTRTAAGWEVYDFQYPSDPNVIMGADRDQDGSYPPHDTDDTAVFEGGTPTDYMTFMNYGVGAGSEDTDRWEFAHFTVKDYCTHTPVTDPNEVCGAIIEEGDGTNDHLYWHDLHLDGVNKEHAKGSFAIWLYELWGQGYTYNALENILGTDISGYAMRGSSYETQDYLRVRNVTANHYGCGRIGSPNACPDGQDFRSSATFLKMWGLFDYTELLNNVLDTDNELWNGYNSQGTDVNTCVQDMWIRNNLFIDFNVPIVFQGGFAGGCTSRHADEIWIDSNEFVLQDADQHNMIGVSGSWSDSDPTYYTQDVYIVNNIFRDESATKTLRVCFLVIRDSRAGGPDPSGSTITFSNNTCYSDDWDGGSYGAFTIDTDEETAQQHAYVVKNNIFAGGDAGGKWFSIPETIASFDSDYNIFEDDGQSNPFSWQGSSYSTLPAFSAASGTDTNSKGDSQNACDVTFVSALDLHLASGDTCAQDESTSTGDGMSSVFTHDFDDETRPQNALWDIGADEYASGYTPVGACCDSTCEVTTDAACTDWRGAGTTCSSNPCGEPSVPVGGFAEGVSFKGVSKE